jgi:hypothetical protein
MSRISYTADRALAVHEGGKIEYPEVLTRRS